MSKSDYSNFQGESGLPDWLVIGFTGDRKLASESILREALQKVLEHPSVKDRCCVSVSSAASGADSVFLEEMKTRQIPRFVILPFDRDTFRKDFNASQWTRVEPLIESATDCEILAGDLPRNEALLEAGILTVDRCDLLIVCWNGQPATDNDGTSDLVAYARALGKSLIIVDDNTGNLTCERLNELPMPVAPPSSAMNAALHPMQIVVAEHKRLGAEAKTHGPRSRNMVLEMIFLNLGASAIAIMADMFFSSEANVPTAGYSVNDAGRMMATFAKLVTLSYALVLVQKHHYAHSQWINSRLGAELCRCYLAIWKFRRSSAIVPETEGMDVDDLARSLRILWYLGKDQAVDLETARVIYHQQRIEDQRQYFQSSLDKTAPWLKWSRHAATAGTIGAIVAVLISLIPDQNHESLSYTLVKASSLLLPLLSAAILSFVVARDIGRRSVRYRYMVEILRKTNKRLENVKTWPGMWRLVASTEREFLREVLEWHAVARFGRK